MLTPRKLFPGARVAILGASGPVTEERLEAGLKAVRSLGLEPVVYPSARSRHGYLAGTDDVRAADLNAAFADDSIDGILCMRGGYGAHRLVGLIDLDTVRAHPKFFSGYSDVTALHIAFNQICGMVTYHTIMPTTEYYKELDDYSMLWLRKAMFEPMEGPVANPKDAPGMTAVTGGKASGTLVGGNLSLVQQSIGTPWAVDTKGKVLFLEDIGEKPYRIDAMLTHLRNAGVLGGCAGIVLGYWTGCEAEEPQRSLTIDEVIDELIRPLCIPCVKSLCCGHQTPSCALPLGAQVTLDADACTLTIDRE